MKKTLYAVSAAIAAMAMCPAANATIFNIVLTQNATTFTAGFSNGGLSGAFSDTFNFSPAIGKSKADVSLTNVGSDVAHIIFSKIQLDGIDLMPKLVTDNLSYNALLGAVSISVSPGLHTLLIQGTAPSIGGNASYGGNVNFALAPVPEPATWAMMIAGIAAVGTAMRRRSQVSRVAFS